VGSVSNNNGPIRWGSISGESVVKQYIINYWEDGGKYTMVIGSTDFAELNKILKNRFNRFTIDVIE
jgi:hypothetical protein